MHPKSQGGHHRQDARGAQNIIDQNIVARLRLTPAFHHGLGDDLIQSHTLVGKTRAKFMDHGEDRQQKRINGQTLNAVGTHDVRHERIHTGLRAGVESLQREIRIVLLFMCGKPAQEKFLHFIGDRQRAQLHFIEVLQIAVPIPFEAAGDDDPIGAIRAAPLARKPLNLGQHRIAKRPAFDQSIPHIPNLIQAVQQNGTKPLIQHKL